MGVNILFLEVYIYFNLIFKYDILLDSMDNGVRSGDIIMIWYFIY